jgi:Cof subfamily protein (haloacid dehalogenase superfamily)
MSYELAVLDLDGTLLPEKGVMDLDVVQAWRRAQSRGLRMTIATGRMPPATQPYIDLLGIIEPVIFYNGALVRDLVSGKDLAAHTLPPGLAHEASLVFSLVPVDPLFYKDDRLFCFEVTPQIREYCEEERLTVGIVNDPQAFLKESLIKVLLIGSPLVLDDLRRALVPLVTSRGRLVNSRPHYLEILPREASKGNALRVLSRHLGIPRERILAAGDQENDLELIREAGLGIAMSHSPEVLKAVADRIAPPFEQGGLLPLLRDLLPEYFG